MISDLFREDLKDFKVYNTNYFNNKIKLDANENPFNLLEFLEEDILKSVKSCFLNKYPDGEAKELCKSYSQYAGASLNNIVAGNGSDELIQLVINAFLNEKEKVLVLNPDFSMYKIYTKIIRGKLLNFSYDSNFNLNIDKLIDTVNLEKVKILFISNPNNPLGKIILKEDIEKILKSCSNCIVVIDEAYTDFCNESVVDKINYYENLIVLRTCSKAIGIAALRVGFALANEVLINEIKKVKSPFNVNSLSQAIAKVVLENKNLIKSNIKKIISEREYLFNKLEKIKNITPIKSNTNFILIEIKSDNKNIYNKLLEKDIVIRSFNDDILKNYIRVTVGDRKENDYFVQALKEIFNN
ncbi:histidinol-phosphate aminotransferase [Clostridium acetireducens DSM 10703]|uniref:Histidinol-phosphate aminotransferase n=1 Tax=Clostridium acetireducens DSM 10703 TaxID=1121290 RepID=A0A1E8EXU3_9CLOT|nr:histidinol-phosphate transaminase [Clostridium acetireducens]OFI05359.1 histidinol-phosphate aminotransferase [Clostridium acetireducens DSM 10703]